MISTLSVIPRSYVENLDEKHKEALEGADKIKEKVADYATEFSDLKQKTLEIISTNAEIQLKFESREQAQSIAVGVSSTVPIPGPDEEQEAIAKIEECRINIAISHQYSDEIEEKLSRIFGGTLFAFKEAKEAKALLTKLVDHKDNMCSNTVKMKTFADKMKSKPQAEAVKKEAEKIYKGFRTFFDKQQANLDKKLSENPDSLRDTNEDDSLSTEPRSNPRSTQLKRLSLPVFSGAKMEYMRFKQEFKDHVKYENEKDRLYALKYECVKPADRKKIANLKTVKECFDVLDKTYGNVHSLVTEVFNKWNNLKIPVTDQQFIRFAEQIEEGVHFLNSLDTPIVLDHCNSAVILESKLNERQRIEYTKQYLKPDADPLKRWENFLLFVDEEKVAAETRITSFTPIAPPKKSDKEGPDTRANNTGAERGSFRGRGRGRGRGSPKNEQDKKEDKSDSRRGRSGPSRGGKSTSKRGKIDNKCLVCKEDHATPKCPSWTDESSLKSELLYVAQFQLPQPFCLWCLEQGHWDSRCPNYGDNHGCPCGNDLNIRFCQKTDDCKSRKNWKDAAISIATSASIASSHTLVNGVQMGDAILPIQMVPIANHSLPIRVMFDNCSQSKFIRTETANKLNLKGIPISFVLVCTDGCRTPMTGKLFDIKFVDINGQEHHIKAVGIETLSTTYAGFKAINVSKQFKHLNYLSNLTDDKLSRSQGQLDVLVGSDLSNLHPKAVANVGQLTIMKSKFGSGFTVMGHNKKHIKMLGKEKGVKANCCAVDRLQFVDPSVSCNIANTKDFQFLTATSIDSIGIQVSPKCSTCKRTSENCKECKLITKNTTYLESLEDKQINENIEYLPDEKTYLASYPYNKEIGLLIDNKEIAFKRAKSLETNLAKTPAEFESLNKTLFDSFDRGLFRFLTDDEIKNWNGMVHYLPYNRVYKDSESTPCRLVFDFGQPDANGRSLNSCMGKG